MADAVLLVPNVPVAVPPVVGAHIAGPFVLPATATAGKIFTTCQLAGCTADVTNALDALIISPRLLAGVANGACIGEGSSATPILTRKSPI